MFLSILLLIRTYRIALQKISTTFSKTQTLLASWNFVSSRCTVVLFSTSLSGYAFPHASRTTANDFDAKHCSRIYQGDLDWESRGRNGESTTRGWTCFWFYFPTGLVQSTDHELIPARNASLSAMQGSASGSNVRYYPTWKHSPLRERNEKCCYNNYN
jgi:hypothetical protein